MPALVDIRRRIRSVKNTQQITKAMKMVSAAKLRRAQDAMFAARPYARKMVEVLESLALRVQPDSHPLLQERPEQKVLLVLVTADKGLCGGFNANILRAAGRFLEEKHDKDVSLEIVGRRGRDFFKRRRFRVNAEHVGLPQPLKYPVVQGMAKSFIEGFLSGRFDHVYLLYNEFKSVIQQRIVVQGLLPLDRPALQDRTPAVGYLYEPGPQAIFDELLPKYVEVQVWRALLESAAAEHGARMAAMDAATNNASDMIDRLTLYMNKVRQAAITKEIIEVVSGASS
jgi:F-type H+-transporting ATPase subunit gamma